MSGALQGTICAHRACTACGRTVWVLLETGTCAPCRGYGSYDDEDTEANAMAGVVTKETLDIEITGYRAAIAQLTPLKIESDATRDAFVKYLGEVRARWGQLDSLEHEPDGLSWDSIKKAREFYAPAKTIISELEALLKEKVDAYGGGGSGLNITGAPKVYDVAEGWTYVVKDLNYVPIAGHVLNQNWVRSEVDRQLKENPTIPPDVPGLRFSRKVAP